METLRAQQKQQSRRPSESELQELARLKEQTQQVQTELSDLERERQQLLDRLPNPPADDTPDGGEHDFAVLREVGQKPSFAFAPRDHAALTEEWGGIDLARGTKVSGSRFAYRVGDVALLELALYRYALQRVVDSGHVPMLPPVLVRRDAIPDFQSRRLDIRFRNSGRLEYVHTLNGTAITARAMLAILETFQEADGSVTIPQALQEFGAPHRLGPKPT
jgi:seryl-tRNA synthetase